MIEIDVEQNTDAWTKFRNEGVGASESAALKGICPYSTAYTLWLNKTGRGKPFEDNFGMQRGRELESKIRSRFELEQMQDFNPKVGRHPNYPMILASFDGVSDDGKELLEIKTTSKATLESVDQQIIPPHYYCQVQQQLLVSGADVCHFYVYNEKLNVFATCDARPDLEYQANLILLIENFWNNHVLKDIPPPLTNKDVKQILPSENPELSMLCNQLVASKDELDKKDIDNYKAMLIDLAGHNKFKCGLVQISEVMRGDKFSYYRLTVEESQEQVIEDEHMKSKRLENEAWDKAKDQKLFEAIDNE